MSAAPSIALIGFGEVGQILGADLRAGGAEALSAWDLKFSDPSSPLRARAHDAGLRVAANAIDVAAGASIVISAVTAGECTAAAHSVAAGIAAGCIYLDLNSVAPRTKSEAADSIAARGGRYVEAAVMSPILPRRISSPILLGGPHAEAFLPVARTLGFAGTELFSDVLGRASAAKMCRSVMVKGIESLLTESLLAARRYGVEDAVLGSLNAMLPVGDWPKLARYMISRSLQHGTRRAEEMREVARAVADAGLDPLMSAACAERQDWAAAYGAMAGEESLAPLLDAMLARIPAAPGGPTR